VAFDLESSFEDILGGFIFSLQQVDEALVADDAGPKKKVSGAA